MSTQFRDVDPELFYEDGFDMNRSITFGPEDFWDSEQISEDQDAMWSEHRHIYTLKDSIDITEETEAAYEEDEEYVANELRTFELRRLLDNKPSLYPHPEEWRDEADEQFGIVRASGELSLDQMINIVRITELPKEKPTTKAKPISYKQVANFEQQIDEVEVATPPFVYPTLTELEEMFEQGKKTGVFDRFTRTMTALNDISEEFVTILDLEVLPIGVNIPVPVSDRKYDGIVTFWDEFNREGYVSKTEETVTDDDNILLVEKESAPTKKYIKYSTKKGEAQIVHPYDAAVDVEEYLSLLQEQVAGRYAPMHRKIAFRNHRDAVRAAVPAKAMELAIVFHIDAETRRAPRSAPLEIEDVLEDLNGKYHEEKPVKTQVHPLYAEMKALEALIYDRMGRGGSGRKNKPSIGKKTVPNITQARLDNLREIILRNESFYDGSRVDDRQGVDDAERLEKVVEASQIRPKNQNIRSTANPMAKKDLKPTDHPKIWATTRPIFL